MAYQPHVRGTVNAANSSAVALGTSATFTGTFVDISLYDGISVLVDGTAGSPAPGTLQMQFSHDGSTVHRSVDITVADVAATPPRTLGTIAQFFRVIYTNGGSVAQSTFDLQTMFHVGFVRLVSRLDSAVGDDEDVQNVRAFLGGLDVLAGAYKNVSMAASTNDSGTYNAIQVATGARPSQLPGRVAVRIVTDAISLSTLEYTVTAGKTLYITDLLVTIEQSANNLGQLLVRDGTTVAGPIVLPFFVADPGAGSTSVTTVTHSFVEPLEFTAGVFWEEANGTLTMSGVMLGYEE